MENFETVLSERLKPLVTRIEVLEESEKNKNSEIITLKHCISDLS